MAEVQNRYLSRKEGEDIPHPWDYYPELFEEEMNYYQEKKEKEKRAEYWEQRRSYMEEFNRRRHPEESTQTKREEVKHVKAGKTGSYH